MGQEIKYQCLKWKRFPAFKLLLPRKTPLTTLKSFNSFLPLIRNNYKAHAINLLTS